jgi:hypothetical protein
VQQTASCIPEHDELKRSALIGPSVGGVEAVLMGVHCTLLSRRMPSFFVHQRSISCMEQSAEAVSRIWLSFVACIGTLVLRGKITLRAYYNSA